MSITMSLFLEINAGRNPDKYDEYFLNKGTFNVNNPSL